MEDLGVMKIRLLSLRSVITIVIHVFTWILDVETIKNGSLGLRMALWLQSKVRDRGLGLQPKAVRRLCL